MNEAVNWTKLLLEKQQQQAAVDRTAQALRQDQLSETSAAAGRLAGAMRKYREDGIAAKLRNEASLSGTTQGAAAKALARERLRSAAAPGSGARSLPASSHFSPAPPAGSGPLPAVSTSDPVAPLSAAGIPGAFMKTSESNGPGPRIGRNQPPPADAVNYLLANPHSSAAFNAKYGPGTAESYLE